jgi:hypothetical protein
LTAESLQDVSFAFLSILFEGAPFILLGTLISGFIDVYLPAGTMDRLLPRNRTGAVLVAGLLGGIFPVCECAVVPVIRRLVAKGLPVSCAITYMLAAPILNPVTALSTWKAFTGQGAATMTCSRLILGYLVAVAVGLVVARMPLRRVLRAKLADSLEAGARAAELAGKEPAGHCLGCGAEGHHHDHDHNHAHGHHHHHDHGPACHAVHGEHAACACHDHAAAESAEGTRLVAAFRSALKDFVDVGVYFTVGVAITALFNTGIAPGASWLDRVASQPLGAPAALMALAYVLSLCSTSDAFIAATLDRFTYGAKLAFLVFGPMMDVKLTFLYQTVMRRRFIAGMAAGIFLAVGAVTVFWQHLLLQYR